MSIRALAWAFDQTTGSPISKLVLIKLADNANEQTGLCIPSIPTISQQTELSPRAIQLHIKKLEELKLVRIERRMVEGVHVSNRYYLAFGGGERHAGGVVHDMHHGGAPHSPGVVHDMRPNQKIEPELNLKNNSESRQSLKTRLSGKPENPTAEEIYNAYPIKVAKPRAIAAIQKQLKQFPAEMLLSRTKAFAASRNGDLQFCPHPATWFNQERFNDDPSTWKPKDQQTKPVFKGNCI